MVGYPISFAGSLYIPSGDRQMSSINSQPTLDPTKPQVGILPWRDSLWGDFSWRWTERRPGRVSVRLRPGGLEDWRSYTAFPSEDESWNEKNIHRFVKGKIIFHLAAVFWGFSCQSGPRCTYPRMIAPQRLEAFQILCQSSGVYSTRYPNNAGWNRTICPAFHLFLWEIAL